MCKIVNWRNNLKFPDEAKLTPEAKDIISRLLCDVEHRLGTRGVAEIKVGWSSELVAQSFKRSNSKESISILFYIFAAFLLLFVNFWKLSGCLPYLRFFHCHSLVTSCTSVYTIFSRTSH